MLSLPQCNDIERGVSVMEPSCEEVSLTRKHVRLNIVPGRSRPALCRTCAPSAAPRSASPALPGSNSTRTRAAMLSTTTRRT